MAAWRRNLLALVPCLLLAATAGAAENLIHNGDFEMASPTSPPPGWAMWGASQYKDPKNFTRDTTNPHAGQACFRIRHPANTAGYIVSSPEHAIRPKKGMMYSASFRARTDKPGSSIFGFEGYESIKPFIDGPSPGFFPVDVGTEWKQFTFEIHEGWDFFADRSRFILLVFKTTTNAPEEKTLWIDDVVVTEQPSTRKGRLFDLDSMQHPPLDHRLKAGKELAFTVDAAKRLRRATRLAGGVSFHRVAGWSRVPYSKEGEYVLHPELEKAIRDMRLPMTRFYAVGDEPFGLEAALDKAAALLDRLAIPQDTTVLEFETQGATSKLPPEVWARGVQHSLSKGYKFRHWEITNEPYVGRSNRAFPTPDAYIAHFLAVSDAIRKVHPVGQIGIAVHPGSGAWGNYVLKQAAGRYDFVVGHHYCGVDVNKSKFEDIVLTANFQKLDDILKLNALIRACNPNREVYQLDTEWGMHSGGPKGERADYVNRNANVYGTLHRAVRLIYYTREDLLRGASSWEMFTRLNSPGFGFLAQEAPTKRSMFYWLYYYFNHCVGDWVVDISGEAPYYTGRLDNRESSGPLTPVVATVSDDGERLFLVIANGGWDKAQPCRVTLRNFAPAEDVGVVALSHSDPDAHPFADRKEDMVAGLPVLVSGDEVKCTLPPHSIVFAVLRAK